METKTISGHSSGMPVLVSAFVDGVTLKCVICCKNFATDSLYVAHAMAEHPAIVCGGNPAR
jgi:hypothetical protein